MARPLTTAEKLALRNWIQANIHRAVRVDWYREGVKVRTGSPDPEAPDYNPRYGKPVYGTCVRLDSEANARYRPAYDYTGSPDPEAPDYNPNFGEQTGTELDTYWGRLFIVRTHYSLNMREVVRRVWRKALKQQLDPGDPDFPSLQTTYNFLRPYFPDIRRWAKTSISGPGRSDEEIDAIDPDSND